MKIQRGNGDKILLITVNRDKTLCDTNGNLINVEFAWDILILFLLLFFLTKPNLHCQANFFPFFLKLTSYILLYCILSVNNKKVTLSFAWLPIKQITKLSPALLLHLLRKEQFKKHTPYTYTMFTNFPSHSQSSIENLLYLR